MSTARKLLLQILFATIEVLTIIRRFMSSRIATLNSPSTADMRKRPGTNTLVDHLIVQHFRYTTNTRLREKGYKTMKQFKLLPSPYEAVMMDNFFEEFERCVERASTLDYIPESIEELKAMDCMDFRIMLSQNDYFFNAAITLCADLVIQMIEDMKSFAAKDNDDSLNNVDTLDDFLNCNYFGLDYDSSRREFATVFAEDYLFND